MKMINRYHLFPAGLTAHTGLLAGVDCSISYYDGIYTYACEDGTAKAKCESADDLNFTCSSGVGKASPPKDQLKNWFGAALDVSPKEISFSS
jgi:hypothetical protein